MIIIDKITIRKHVDYTIVIPTDLEGEEDVEISLPLKGGEMMSSEEIAELIKTKLEELGFDDDNNLPANKIVGRDERLNSDGDVIREAIQIPIEAIPKITSNKLDGEAIQGFVTEQLDLDEDGYLPADKIYGREPNPLASVSGIQLPVDAIPKRMPIEKLDSDELKTFVEDTVTEQFGFDEYNNLPANKIVGNERTYDENGDIDKPAVQLPLAALPFISPDKISGQLDIKQLPDNIPASKIGNVEEDVNLFIPKIFKKEGLLADITTGIIIANHKLNTYDLTVTLLVGVSGNIYYQMIPETIYTNDDPDIVYIVIGSRIISFYDRYKIIVIGH